MSIHRDEKPTGESLRSSIYPRASIRLVDQLTRPRGRERSSPRLRCAERRILHYRRVTAAARKAVIHRERKRDSDESRTLLLLTRLSAVRRCL